MLVTYVPVKAVKTLWLRLDWINFHRSKPEPKEKSLSFVITIM